MGVVQLAKATGLPIVPLTSAAQKKNSLRVGIASLCPYPFSRGIFLWGEPIHVSREAAASELEHKRVELENNLNRMTSEADAAVRRRSA